MEILEASIKVKLYMISITYQKVKTLTENGER